MPKFNDLIKQAQQLQERMTRLQEEAGKKTVEATAGGGMVTAVVTGGPELIEVKISPEVVDPDDVEMLEDLVIAAVRQAMEAAVEAANSQLGGLAGGLDMGGLLG